MAPRGKVVKLLGGWHVTRYMRQRGGKWYRGKRNFCAEIDQESNWKWICGAAMSRLLRLNVLSMPPVQKKFVVNQWLAAFEVAIIIFSKSSQERNGFTFCHLLATRARFSFFVLNWILLGINWSDCLRKKTFAAISILMVIYYSTP